jgi:uncharacterized protein YyaL (SSP411 family)
VLNLTLLSHVRDEPAWDERIQRTLRLFAPRLEQIGRAVPMMAAAFSTYASGLTQVVIVGEGADARALVDATDAAYRPFSLVLPLTPDAQQRLAASVPLVAAMRPVNGGTAAYVCRDFACRAPVTSREALARELDSASRRL